MTATADALLGVAASQVGYFKKPGSITKYGSWYGIPTGQWCAMFVSWCADQVDALDIIPKHAYTPSGVSWFKQKKQWHDGISGIKRGDIVYYDFPGLPNRVSHVGIVESVNTDGSFNTIEGNTSGPAGDQRNGGCCLRKTRKAYAVGYGRPDYEKPIAINPKTKKLVINGEWNRATIKRLQKALGGLEKDGLAGPLTWKATQKFLNKQEKKGVFSYKNGPLVIDGIPGIRTISALQKWLNAQIRKGKVQRKSGPLKVSGRFNKGTVKMIQKSLNKGII